MEIGTSFRKLRDSKGLSAREIAEKIGIAQSTYTDWENDKSSPSLKNYLKIAEAFEMNPAEFIIYLTGEVTTVSRRRNSEISDTEILELKEKVEILKKYTLLLGNEKELIKSDIKTIMIMIAQIQKQFNV